MKRDASGRGLAIAQVEERDQENGLPIIGERKLVAEGWIKTDTSTVLFPVSAFG